MIDLVLPYVDCEDRQWRKQFTKLCMDNDWLYHKDSERYRCWGTLKYLLRAIAQNMPWINKLHLIVQMESQIPEWINRETVNIVLHKDYIPSKFLPLYNSGTIEMFLWNIPNLQEKFIYINDDMFPIGDLLEADFFKGDLPKIKYYSQDFYEKKNMYSRMLRHNAQYIADMLGIQELPLLYRFYHNMNPQLKSVWKKIYDFNPKRIHGSISTFRKGYNLTQDLIQDYFLYTKKYEPSERKSNYVSSDEMQKACDILKDPKDIKLLCINDNSKHYQQDRQLLLTTLQDIYKEPCKYEKTT